MKQKTVKSAEKRVDATGSGKIRHRKTSAQHRVDGKSKRVRSDATKKTLFNRTDAKKIKELVPYL